MTFSYALDALKGGSKIHRDGWNGKGIMFLTLQDGEICQSNRLPVPLDPEGWPSRWTPEQTDILADDWQETPIGVRSTPEAT